MGIDAAGRPMTYGQMMRNKTTGKMKRPAGRALALLAGFVLLFGAAFAEEEDVDLSELLDLSEVEEDLEEVEILPPDATLLARDKQWHTPAEGSPYKCNHEVCYWTTPMGYTDEAAVWEMLIQPITVLDANQRHQVKIRKEPDKDCTEYTGEVTGASQGVHVLERGEEWSLIEAYSSSPEGSRVKVWAEKFQGYVETSLLKEVEVDQQYAVIIDKQWQRLYVYKEGKLFSTLLCSTGFYNPKKKNPWNETPAGEFLAISWTGDFSLKDEATGEGYMICKKAIRINDGILLHEVPMVLSKSTGEWTYDNCEGYLGEKASHGCIRIQRNYTPEGVNHEWLWKNLSDGTKPGQKYTKVVIWDDANRELGYPGDDLILYYNTDKGTRYHSSPTCYGVKEKFWPLTPFRYGELDDAPYNKLKPCPYCAPQPRKDAIDKINKKNNR